MMKEERILFPMIKNGLGSRWGPISVMEHEHDDGEIVEVIKFITKTSHHHLKPATWRVLYNGIMSLLTI